MRRRSLRDTTRRNQGYKQPTGLIPHLCRTKGITTPGSYLIPDTKHMAYTRYMIAITQCTIMRYHLVGDIPDNGDDTATFHI